MLVILVAVTAATIIFKAISVMAIAYTIAIRHLTEAFIATVDFAKIIGHYFLALLQKIRDLFKE